MPEKITRRQLLKRGVRRALYYTGLGAVAAFAYRNIRRGETVPARAAHFFEWKGFRRGPISFDVLQRKEGWEILSVRMDAPKIQLRTIFSDRPVPADELIKRIRAQYGSRFLFAASGTYFDPDSGRVLFRLEQDGKRLSEASSGKGTYMVYNSAQNSVSLSDSYQAGSMVVGGLVRVVRNGKVQIEQGRVIDQKRPAYRVAFGIKGGKPHMFCDFSPTVQAFAENLAAHGITDAALLDGGQHAVFYYHDPAYKEILYIVKPHKPVTNLVYAVASR